MLRGADTVTVMSRTLKALLAARAAARPPPLRRRGRPVRPAEGQGLERPDRRLRRVDFERRAGKHPAVWQHFVAWGGNYQYTIDNSRSADARPMYHLSTSKGQNLPERFSPGEIARGKGDGFLVALTRDIAARRHADLHAAVRRDEQLQQPVRVVRLQRRAARRATTRRRRSSRPGSAST